MALQTTEPCPCTVTQHLCYTPDVRLPVQHSLKAQSLLGLHWENEQDGGSRSGCGLAHGSGLQSMLGSCSHLGDHPLKGFKTKLWNELTINSGNDQGSRV